MRFLEGDRWIANNAPGVILVMAVAHAPVAGFALWYAHRSAEEHGEYASSPDRAVITVLFVMALFLMFSGAMSVLRARDTRRAIAGGNDDARWASPLVTMVGLIGLTLGLMGAVFVDAFVLADRFMPEPEPSTWVLAGAAGCALVASIFFVLGVFARRARLGHPLFMDWLGGASLMGAVGCLLVVLAMKVMTWF